MQPAVQAMMVAMLLVGPAAAQAPGPPGGQSAMTPTGTTALPRGYLADEPPVDVLKLLPPPPASGSAAEAADRAGAEASRAGIGGRDWQAAVGQLSVTAPAFTAALGCAAGAVIDPAATPTVRTMLARAGADFAAPMTLAKAHYRRPRPFAALGGPACDPDAADGKGEALGWAYPSGHSGVGWLWALILSDLRPERAEALRGFGLATGDLRLACRVHWLSDVAAGRSLAALVHQRIAATPAYQADLARARAELAAAPAPQGCAG